MKLIMKHLKVDNLVTFNAFPVSRIHYSSASFQVSFIIPEGHAQAH